MTTVTVKDGRAYLYPQSGSYSGGSITADHIFELKLNTVKEDVQRNPIELERPRANLDTETSQTMLIELGRAKRHFELNGIINVDNGLSYTKSQLRDELRIIAGIDKDTPESTKLTFLYKNEGNVSHFWDNDNNYGTTIAKFNVNEKSDRNQTDDPNWDVIISLILGNWKG